MQEYKNAIEIINLNKEYSLIDENGNATVRKALHNINETIKKGEVIGIIGQNGSGKTTLLKMLGGTIKPTSGIIKTYGKVASIIDIGSGINPELSGYDNIFFMGNLYGFSNLELKNLVYSIIEFSGIKNYIYNPVKTYSNGMYLRLSFSILTHLDFDIYLFDEVIAVGDQEFQEKCKLQFERLIQLKKTILVVTHQMNFLLENFNRFLVLNEGIIKYSANNSEAISKYIQGNIEMEYTNRAILKGIEFIKIEPLGVEHNFRIFRIEIEVLEQVNINLNTCIVVKNFTLTPIISDTKEIIINTDKKNTIYQYFAIQNELLFNGSYYFDVYFGKRENNEMFCKLKNVLKINIADNKDNKGLGIINSLIEWNVKP